jgi:hypothetical protein
VPGECTLYFECNAATEKKIKILVNEIKPDNLILSTKLSDNNID